MVTVNEESVLLKEYCNYLFMQPFYSAEDWLHKMKKLVNFPVKNYYFDYITRSVTIEGVYQRAVMNNTAEDMTREIARLREALGNINECLSLLYGSCGY